ncbi:FecR domain-containing protein [Chitinophaga sancti]|uniref:FecR family protein n=1 Tax=Chitinophaga sancti TaxID=1004 RepID=UPI002A74F3C6|nr:FecR domain-containing protein [Chitinophaga sancti]WPQ61088.1 FecR domain-containing protein [Chitinophaga sancti]
MNISDIRHRLADYQAGKLDAAGKQELQQALEGLSEQELSELFPVDAFVNNTAHQLPEAEIDAALARFRYNRQPAVKLASLKVKPVLLKNVSRYAAIFVLLLGSSFLIRKGVLNWEQKAARRFRTMRIADGNHGSITLSDGSRVTINGGSILYFPEEFEDSARIVYVEEGEAYFEIARDAKRPFYVRSPQLNVKVLGTSFTVRDYKDEHTAIVNVNSGKIGLKGLVLSAGMGLTADKRNGTFIKEQIDTANTTAWIRGELIFQDAGLQQVLQVLQHKYAVHFEVKDATLLKRKYTATFRNNTIENVMQQLKLMSSFQYTITDNQIVIR